MAPDISYSPLPSVLFLHRGGNQIRGSEEALLTILDSLDRAELRPLVVSSSSVFAQAVAARGIDSVVSEFPEIMLAPGEVRFPFIRYAKALWHLIRRSRANDVRVVFNNGGGPCQLGIPLGVLIGVPSMCLFHHPAPKTYHIFWLTRFVDRMLYASEFTASHTRQRIGARGEVVYIGIDTERFSPGAGRNPQLRESYGIGTNEVVFAQIGALVPHKNHALLIDAFERVTRDFAQVRLFIVGAGPEADNIRRYTEALGLSSRVVLTGYVKDTLPYLQHLIDVNILASREEGLGLVNLQASACGLPNVASNTTGITETILDGKTGYLFQSGDAESLAGHMLTLAQNPALRRELGTAGRAFVVARFSSRVYADRIGGIIRELAGIRAS